MLADDRLNAQLAALFADELQDNLQILSDGLAALEEAGPEMELVRRLFRAAHSLKGAAHSAGVVEAIGPCRRMEGLFAALRDGEQDLDRAGLNVLSEDVARLTALERRLRRPSSDQTWTPAATSSASSDPGSAFARTDVRARVTVRRLDQLVERAGALVALTQRFHSLVDAIETNGATTELRATAAEPSAPSGADGDGELTRDLRGFDRQLRSLAGQVADTAQELRLQPFADVTAGLDQAVRALCRTTGTEARLEIEGHDVELDRDVGDALREPLLHCVRNAVDHGIEPPSARIGAGKAATGIVRVTATEQGSYVQVTVSDDGAGIDVEALRELVGEDFSPGADLELAYLPGISTAETVTDVSGRGMGLDAARSAVESVGGSFSLESNRGRGTTVRIRAPRSLAVLRVLIVDAGAGGLVAFPLSAVSRLLRIDPDDIEHVEDRLAVVIDERRRPAVLLAAALSLPRSSDATTVAVGVSDEEGVLLVQRAVTELDVLLRPLPHYVDAAASLLGAALLPTGDAALVVNPSVALRTGLAVPTGPIRAPTSHDRRRILLVEDTPTTRALERSILERAGHEVLVAVDGLDALEQLRDQTVDAIVTDIDMPRMSGIELCRAVRSSVRHGKVPVILVTSLASEDDRRAGLDAGANAYLVKSAFDQDALIETVGRFV